MNARPWLLACLTVAACGKEDNRVPDRGLTAFVHAYPEAPRALRANVTTPWSSGRPLGVTATHLIAADRDNGTLVRIDRATLRADKTLKLGATPEQLIVMGDGSIVVSLRSSGAVAIVSPDFTSLRVQPLGVEAFGVAASRDQQRIYVTLPLESALVTLDRDLVELGRASTFQLPRGVAVTGSGDVVVVHQRSDALRFPVDGDGLPDDSNVRSVELRRQNPADLVNGTSTTRAGGLNLTAGQAVTIDPESGDPLIAHSLAFTGTVFADDGSVVAAPAPAPAYYGDFSNLSPTTAPALPIEVTVTSDAPPEIELPVTDTITNRPLNQMIDQPSDVLAHPSRSLLFVTGKGTDNVLVLSTAEGDPMRSPLGLIEVGHAPTGIAFSEDGRTAWVLNSQEFSISEIDLGVLLALEPSAEATAHPRQTGDAFFGFAGATETVGDHTYNWDATPDSPRAVPVRVPTSRTATFAADPLTPAERRGVRLFTFTHDDRVSKGGSFACASCHIDGGDDGLVWLTGDGPRQTPALAGRLDGTGPFNWNGTRDDLQSNMQATVQRMGGSGLGPHELADLEGFLLDELPTPKSPFVAPDGLTPEQARGKAIFESAEAACTRCHRLDQRLTDGLEHDVGTASDLDRARAVAERDAGIDPRPAGLFNTPSLQGLFYTAPYLHDGSAPTLADVLERTKTTMGDTSHLTPDERAALIAYLQTL
ncbi:MAG: c-type cytochrome [Myxococcota bacterium]